MPDAPYSLSKLFLLLGVMLLALAGVYVISLLASSPEPVPQTATNTLGDAIRAGTAPIPSFSTSSAQKLARNSAFHALVSYTDLGFEPRALTVQRGETVRFTNNSSADLWIAADGTNVHIYPRTGDTCGPSDLDSCEPFTPQDFWEFTFDIAGEWEVTNNLDKSRNGLVRVE